MWCTSSLLLVLLAGCGEPATGDPCAAPGNICRVAGTGEQGFNGDGLAATESWMYLPSSLAWSPEHDLVITDYNNYRIREVAPDGTMRTIVGSGVHAYAQPGETPLLTPLENPIDAVWGPDGLLYISGSHEARVLRIGETGFVEVVAGTGAEGDEGDGGLATEATFSALLGGISFADDGTLYIADSGNNCVRGVRPDQRVYRTADELGGPQSVTAAGGVVYVPDTLNGRILEVSPANGGVAVLLEGLSFPSGVTVGPDDRLYVADSGNNRILAIDGDDVEVIAGTGERGIAGDGAAATDATLDWPVDLLFDPDGDLYEVEMRGAVVRRIAGVAGG